MNEWKKIHVEIPKMCEEHEYSEDIVFVTKNNEVHNGFFFHNFWFDVDEEWSYSTKEVTEWIYLKDIQDDENE